MKNLKVIAVMTLFLLAMSATSLLAQNRHGRTSGAKAAYGYPTAEFSSKKKKKKQKKHKAAKRRGTQPLYRKKNPWVN